jgi:hypothetical protein
MNGKKRVVVWEQWETNIEASTCDECAGLNGQLFRQGEGPQPPLHPNCHCYRRYHHTEIVDEGSGE